LIRGRGNDYIREAKPLFDSPLTSILRRRGEEILERGEAPLMPQSVKEGRSPSYKLFPPSLKEVDEVLA